MRVAELQVRIAILAVLASAASSCQTAQAMTTAAPAAPKPAPQQPQPASQPVAAAKPPQVQTQVPTQTPAETKAEPVSPPATPTSDATGDLIARVEKDYQAGLDAYKAGQTDAAKQDFDNAINALLESNLDIRSDDRLEQEFDRIVEGVNRLDLASLGYASDSDAQKSEPAPIDETNGITPSADPNVRAKAQAEIKSTHSDLPLMMTDQVAGYISYFSNRGRGTF